MQHPASDLHLDTFLPFMRDVDRCQRALNELALAWRMIEASTRMNCPEDGALIIPTIEDARRHFDELEQQLIVSLVAEKMTGILREISTKALYIIDIVVRNLYERTADVSFLATDRELCAFAQHPDEDAKRAHCEARLEAYRRKYTVYDALLLVGPDGTVLASAGEEPLPAHCADPAIQEALQRDGYVQIFRRSGLQPAKPEALIYCHRMLGPDGGDPVGVLCLCFNLQEEMNGIFASHRDPGARYNMLLLDGGGRCIASADPDWIPAGRTLPMNPACSAELFMHAGRLHLVATHTAGGYQGYAGPPGWRGQVMIPLEIAFSSRARAAPCAPARTTQGLLRHAGDFCRPLHDVMIAAQTIRRVVWNGQVISGGKAGKSTRLRAVLAQISDTGARSDALFQRSIHGLRDTVLTTGLQDAGFVARLMVDLLDRNLYERANDCRWWALSADLQQALARPCATSAAHAGRILNHINSLYTVYTSIFLYDCAGVVIAHSDRDAGGLDFTGRQVDAAIVQRVLGLRDDQDYAVEGFAPTPFYGDRSTYVYHAAVRGADGGPRTLGGIGLVFDVTPELTAMLNDALAGKPRRQACFIDRQGRVLASSSAVHAPGEPFPIDPELLALENGRSVSRLVVQHGQYTLLGCSVSQGYREFKRDDGYRDDVLAVVYETLGAALPAEAAALEPSPSLQADDARSVMAGESEEYATFLCGGRLYAIEAAHVHEARPADALLPLTLGGRPGSVGMLPVASDTGCGLAWVFDLSAWLDAKAPAATGKEIIVLCRGAHRIGLLVDALQAVGRYTSQPLGGAFDSDTRLIRRIVRTSGHSMIPTLDVDALFQRLGDGGAAAVSLEPVPAHATGEGMAVL